MPPNCMLKKVKTVNFILFIFYHNFKKKEKETWVQAGLCL